MEPVADTERRHSIASLDSSIRKLEKALTSVQQNVASTTVVSKRLKALKIGLAALQTRWENQVYPYSAEETQEAMHIIAGLMPSLHAMAPKFKPSSSQATLLVRRVLSLELALQVLGEM
ncbi:MAG: hypothetical protein RBU26_05660 [Sphaerochaeta sp.]|jgi:hypothetical protein|uniref:hypothetical protein n=1 Tax=Sphaerochaeta sp. TaxID=1972642 RepID=UPI002A369944|nr:hypothetical protein [Sphaerochaeta sp.]MDX9824409.1 hypothetical protein [Sphaerochaeta sp.]